MAQLGVAFADQFDPTPQGDPPWWQKLDETPFDDDTTTTGSIATGFSVMTFLKRNGEPLYDPGIHTGHKVRMRARMASGSQNGSFVLYQGTTANPPNIIAGSGTIALTTAWTTYEFALSTAEAGTITNYSDLRVRINVSGGGPLLVTAVEIELPDAAPNDGAFADTIEQAEAFGSQVLVSAAFADTIEQIESFGALVGAGRLVPQGRRFRVVRTVVDLAPRAVPIVGRGR